MLEFGTSNSTTFAGTITGGGALLKQGSGTVTLSGVNSYRGGTRIEGGVLAISSDAALGEGDLEILSSTLRTTGNMVITRRVGISDATFDVANETYLTLANVQGNQLTKTGSGYLTLTGTQNYSGPTFVEGGFLKLENGFLSTSEVHLTSANFYLVDSTGVLAADITGSGTFARSGAGASILTGTVAPTIATVIESGTLQIGNGGTTGAITGNVLNQGTLSVNRSDAYTYGGEISGSGSVLKLGSGTLTLSGTSAFGGALSPEAGTLNITGHVTSASVSGIASSGTTAWLNISGSGANWTSLTDILIGHNGGTGYLTISDGATAGDTFALVGRTAGGTGHVRVTGAGSTWTHSVGLVIGSSGEGFLDVDSGGVVRVGAGGTGGLTLGDAGASAGTLNIGAAAGQSALAAGTVEAAEVFGGAGSGAKIVNFNHTDTAYTFSPRLTGQLSVQQNGGATILTGSNAYTGGTLVTGGTLSIAQDANLGAVSGTLTMNGGALRTTGNINTTRHVVLAADSTFDVANETYLTFDSTVSGPGGLSKTGTGYLTLNGAQTYTGPTTVQGGFFKIESGSLASSSVDLSSSTFYLANSTGVYAGNITGSGTFNRGGAGTSILTGTVGPGISTQIESGTLQIGNGGATGDIAGNVLNNGTLSVNRSDAYTFGGTISGNGAFRQLGSGTTTLTETNTYTGDTTVSDGALFVNGSIAGKAIVQDGATLGGSGIIGGAVTVQDGGTLSPGNSPGQLTLLNDLTMEDGSTLLIEFAGTDEGLYDQIDVQGLFTAGGILNLMITDAFTPLEGDTFTIFTGVTPGFDAGSFTLVTNLGGGLYWDTSELASTGVVSIVPEPASSGLLILGVFAILAARRRKA